MPEGDTKVLTLWILSSDSGLKLMVKVFQAREGWT